MSIAIYDYVFRGILHTESDVTDTGTISMHEKRTRFKYGK